MEGQGEVEQKGDTERDKRKVTHRGKSDDKLRLKARNSSGLDRMDR